MDVIEGCFKTKSGFEFLQVVLLGKSILHKDDCRTDIHSNRRDNHNSLLKS